MNKQFGIVVRYSDENLDVGFTTVEEHNKIFEEKGKVWFGKFGQPVNSPTLELLSEPHSEKHLILVRKKNGSKDDAPRLFFADCCEARRKTPQLFLIPEYYRKYADREVMTWFHLTSRLRSMSDSEAKNWISTASGETLLDNVRKCPKSFFLVTEKVGRKKST